MTPDRGPLSPTPIPSMKRLPFALLVLAFVLVAFVSQPAPVVVAPAQDDWISLFDGETMEGWQVSENPESFWIEDGAIVANGSRAHLFYMGPVNDHSFTNFEFKADVMTMDNSNAGIYFHTTFQEEGWPSQGYEAQVNNTYRVDPRKTGSIYAVMDVEEAPAADSVWFTQHIIVQDKTITVKINDETVATYTETEDAAHFQNNPGRKLGSGTFALQAHDPGSKVLFRNIMVKVLD